MTEERRIDLKKKEFEKKELEYAEKLLLISKEDLESSEILFKSKKYLNSVREFQQSIEKTTKTFALTSGSIKSEELKKKINHFPFKWYQLGISENLSKVENLERAFREIPELKEIPMMKKLNLKDFKEKSQVANKILSSITKNKKIFSDDIDELDGAIKEMNRNLKEIEGWETKEFDESSSKQLLEESVENIKAFSRLSNERGKPIDEDEETKAFSISEDMIKHLSIREYKNLVLTGITHALNATLNAFIAPHFNFSRYPDLKNPIEYYNEENPLIKRFDQLLEIQKKNILLHEQYLEFVKGLTSEIIIE